MRYLPCYYLSVLTRSNLARVTDEKLRIKIILVLYDGQAVRNRFTTREFFTTSQQSNETFLSRAIYVQQEIRNKTFFVFWDFIFNRKDKENRECFCSNVGWLYNQHILLSVPSARTEQSRTHLSTFQLEASYNKFEFTKSSSNIL